MPVDPVNMSRPKRKFVLDDSSASDAKRSMAMVYRFPVLKVNGETPMRDISNHHFWYFHPNSLTCGETQYDIDWLHSSQLPKATDAEQSHQLKAFWRSAASFLAPLKHLVFDVTSKMWYCPTLVKESLSMSESVITEGFTSEMSNSRGRGMVHHTLFKLLGNDNRVVMNCGGGRLNNEPSVRNITFNYTVVHDEIFHFPESSRTSSRFSHPKDNHGEQEVNCPQQHVRTFVSDIIVEEKDTETKEVKETLVVDVKKGLHLTYIDECQLKYKLLPSALKQKSALGLLICAKEGILMKYSVIDQSLQLRQNRYKFKDNGLPEDMVELMCDLHYNI
ncbi:uncharacterized protein LOC117319313 [Pecten maximus]|uniref:uncharacterized protein LOC117319313 n=1 Tax=Pecten maximus TaxID=6579 RepID=UPI001458D03C|nr:uncharacterized protein LOC117319313 [Pecten maximus]